MIRPFEKRQTLEEMLAALADRAGFTIAGAAAPAPVEPPIEVTPPAGVPDSVRPDPVPDSVRPDSVPPVPPPAEDPRRAALAAAVAAATSGLAADYSEPPRSEDLPETRAERRARGERARPAEPTLEELTAAAKERALRLEREDLRREHEIRSREGRSIAAALPPGVQAAAGLRVFHPKIWETDVRPLRTGRLDRRAWLSRLSAAARRRQKGDVLAPTIVRIGEALIYGLDRIKRGTTRATYQSLAAFAQCCTETARKAIRFLESHSLIDIFNVLMRRENRDIQRAANLYLFRGDPESKPEPDKPEAPATGVISRLAEWAAAMGLEARTWGLNATPTSKAYAPPL